MENRSSARRKDKKRFVEYLRTHEECGHMDDETYGMLALVTHSDRLQELQEIRKKQNTEFFREKEEINMCQAIEEIYEDGKESGREEGGMLKLIAMIARKLTKGKTPEQIAEELEEDREEVEAICRAARQYAPEYDCRSIYESLKLQSSL